MGNNLGGGKTAEVMKINGETFKLRTPARVTDVVKDYPGFVLLDSEAVKHFGIRAKPLEPQQELKANKIYFLIELPEIPEEKEARSTRRVRSAIQMSAKDRLENLMLSRRSVSDLSMVRPSPSQTSDGQEPVRVKVRLPRAQVKKLVEESEDEAEVAGKIIELYMGNSGDVNGTDGHRHVHWKPELGDITESFRATHEKRVTFAQEVGEIRLPVDSH
ncbi:plastid movement impaired protein [Salix suchowensis]|nr:plastid movement impaired protein [Salix suchowensis]KAG5247310.1 plastid movement impaired protein [Salix suchowensis]